MSGLTDKEVATRLGLSQDTVKTYWKRIRQKVGAQTRPEIIAVLLERGAQELLDQNRKEIQRLTRESASHQASEERFRAIADHLPVGVYVTDAQDQGVFVNAAWLSLTGLSRDEALHRGWSAPIHPLDKRRAMEAWNRARQASSPYTDLLRYRCSDTCESCWMSLRATEIRLEGHLIGFVRTLIDVTQEREEREKLLEVSNQKFDLMFIAKPDLVASEEGDTLRFDYVDEGTARFLGAGTDDLICKDLKDALEGECWREFWALLIEASDSGQGVEREIDSPRPTRHAGPVLFRIVPLPDGFVVAGRFVERVAS